MVPPEWYGEPPKYFITYYGDILFGRVVKENPDGSFYILTNNKAQEFSQRTDEKKYDELCDKIPCREIIVEVLNDNQFKVTQYPIDKSSTRDELYNKMFVFGAGASRYCIFDNEKINYEKEFPWKPPLGYEIFSSKYKEIIDQFKEIKTFIPYYINSNKDIELALENEWQDITISFNPNLLLRHIQVQFYIRELMKKISKETISNFNNNLYCLFLDKLQRYLCKNKDEKVILVSFNYDTILDYYIEKLFNYSFNELSDYIDIKNRQIILIKPHGSWNWGWKVDPVKLNGRNLYSVITEKRLNLFQISFNLINDIYNFSWDYESQFNEKKIGRYKLDRNSINVVRSDELNYSYPALLMPYKNKDEIMMTYEMFDAARFLSNNIEELYLIGWKGNEKLFNELILSKIINNLKKIIVVNPKADEVLQNIGTSRNEIRDKLKVFGSFEEFCLNLDFSFSQ